MKKTMSIDAKLLKDVRAACGAATEKDTVRLGLETLVRHAGISNWPLYGACCAGKSRTYPVAV